MIVQNWLIMAPPQTTRQVGCLHSLRPTVQGKRDFGVVWPLTMRMVFWGSFAIVNASELDKMSDTNCK